MDVSSPEVTVLLGPAYAGSWAGPEDAGGPGDRQRRATPGAPAASQFSPAPHPCVFLTVYPAAPLSVPAQAWGPQACVQGLRPPCFVHLWAPRAGIWSARGQERWKKEKGKEGEGTGKGVQSRPGGPRCRVSTRSPSTRIRPTGRPPPGGSGFPAANPLARSTRADGEGATLQAGGAGPGPRPSPELLLSAFGSQPWSRACRSLTVDFLPVVPGTVTLALDGGWGTRHHSRLEQPFPNRTFLP